MAGDALWQILRTEIGKFNLNSIQSPITGSFFTDSLFWDSFSLFLQSEAFIKILSEAKAHPRVIDVGGNIGWYSLLSASLGAKVDVFEPNPANYLRTCESICVNDWVDEPCPQFGALALEDSVKSGRLNIFPVGVGAKEGMVSFDTGDKLAHNPGQGKVTRHESSTGSHNKIRLITLDSVANELGWFGSDIAILKIDVEGLEKDVILGAKHLLGTRRVQNIFLEGNFGIFGGDTDFKEMVNILTTSGYGIHKMGGYLGPKNDVRIPSTGENVADSLSFECKGGSQKPRKQCNMWWKLSTRQP